MNHYQEQAVVDYLIDLYDLDSPRDVRFIDDRDYAEPAIECNGRMPNSVESGWFFAGYEREIQLEMMRST